MTAEERFTKIEHTLTVLAEVQERNQETVSQLIRTVESHIVSSSARMTRLETALADNIDQTNQLREIVSRFEQAADARMRRIEDNLDALIRAITAEHSNGKS